MKTVSYETMYHMPVIVMEGINHGHFASGTMPPNVKSHDLEAEMSYDSAHSIIAGHVGAFLVKSLEQPTEQVSEAEAALNKSFDDTLAITQVRVFLCYILVLFQQSFSLIRENYVTSLFRWCYLRTSKEHKTHSEGEKSFWERRGRWEWEVGAVTKPPSDLT